MLLSIVTWLTNQSLLCLSFRARAFCAPFSGAARRGIREAMITNSISSVGDRTVGLLPLLDNSLGFPSFSADRALIAIMKFVELCQRVTCLCSDVTCYMLHVGQPSPPCMSFVPTLFVVSTTGTTFLDGTKPSLRGGQGAATALIHNTSELLRRSPAICPTWQSWLEYNNAIHLPLPRRGMKVQLPLNFLNFFRMLYSREVQITDG